jgi:hypothetical protein
MRTIDQLCYSSQYYFMMILHVSSVLLFTFGVNMCLRGAYNVFADPANLIILPFIIFCCIVVRWVCVFTAEKLRLWRLKHEDTAWYTKLDADEDTAPDWDELMKLQGMSHQEYLMNQRITSETFRHKFLKYNRPWLIFMLPSILTPRTLRKSRPYLIGQFQKLIKSVNPDISEDDSDDQGVKFGEMLLSASSRTIVQLWLAQARRRKRLREVVEPCVTQEATGRAEHSHRKTG